MIYGIAPDAPVASGPTVKPPMQRWAEDLMRAQGTLAAWARRHPRAVEPRDYGTLPGDFSPTLTRRCRRALASLQRWWNASGRAPGLPMDGAFDVATEAVLEWFAQEHLGGLPGEAGELPAPAEPRVDARPPESDAGAPTERWTPAELTAMAEDLTPGGIKAFLTSKGTYNAAGIREYVEFYLWNLENNMKDLGFSGVRDFQAGYNHWKRASVLPVNGLVDRATIDAVFDMAAANGIDLGVG